VQDLFNSKANNPTERPPPTHPTHPPPQAGVCPANVSQSITQVTWQGGILLSLNNIGTMPRVVMTMKGARDDDDGCWEKGKPVRDDLSELVCSSIGISLSISLSLLLMLPIFLFFFPSLFVFLVEECVCVCVCVCLLRKMARKAFQRRWGGGCVEVSHLTCWVKAG